jgi:hypothetical protein
LWKYGRLKISSWRFNTSAETLDLWLTQKAGKKHVSTLPIWGAQFGKSEKGVLIVLGPQEQ